MAEEGTILMETVPAWLLVLVTAAVAAAVAAVYARYPIADPAFYRKRLDAAVALAKSGRRDVARRRIVGLINRARRVKKPLSPRLATVLGDLHLAAGGIDHAERRPGEAIASYREAVRLVRVPQAVMALVAESYAGEGDSSDTAVEAYVGHLKNTRGRPDSTDPVARFIRSRVAVTSTSNRDDANLALGVVERLLVVQPDRAWLHAARGKALVRLGRDAEAGEALLRAESLDPADASIPLAVAGLHRSHGDLGAEYAALRRSLERNATQPAVLIAMGQNRVECAGGDVAPGSEHLATAAEHLSAARSLAPGDGQCWLLSARLAGARGLHADAQAMALEAVRMAPGDADARMTLAETELALGNKSAAIASLEGVTVIDPGRVEAWLLRADLDLQQNRPETAGPAYARALELLGERDDPNRPGASESAAARDRGRRGLGLCHARLEQWEHALPVLAAVKAHTSDSLYALGRAKGRAGLTPSAISTYRQHVAQCGATPEVLFYLGCALSKLSHWAEAEDALGQAMALAEPGHPLRAQMAIYQGIALTRVGRYADAGVALADAAQRLPSEPLVHYAQGVLSLSLGMLDDAARAFEAARTADPDLAPAAFGLGLAAERKGNWKLAADAYASGVVCQPAWPAGQLRLAIARARLGLWREALPPLEAAQERQEGGPEARFYLGLARALSGDYAGAVEVWRKLQSSGVRLEGLSRNIAGASYSLGRLAFDRGDYDGAIEWWRLCHGQSPDDESLRRPLAEALIRSAMTKLFDNSRLCPDAARMLSLLDEAATLLPDDARPRYYAGLAHLAGGDAGRALPLLKTAHEAAPDSCRVAYHLALAHLKVGDLAAARPLLSEDVVALEGYSPGPLLARAIVAVGTGEASTAVSEFSRTLTAVAVPEQVSGD